MMKKVTTGKFFSKKENWLILAMAGLLFVFGCYEFKVVDQPTEGHTNSTFDVNIVMTEDDDPSNSWTDESGELVRTGLFGVLLPTGWTVTDNIQVEVVSADSLFENDAWVHATSDHSATYTLAYDETQTTMLNDSTPDAPAGYYWWGAATTTPVDMSFFDSLYFTVSVMTDNQVGDFYLQYVAGDVDYWERQPFDPAVQTDPLPINITVPVGLDNKLLDEASLSVYPNPSYGYLTVNLASFDGQPVDMMIYDMLGKQVLRQNLTAGQTTLDLVDLATGTYTMRLEVDHEVLTRKFVKK